MLRGKSNKIVQKLYTENYKAVLRKLEELDVLNSQIRIFNIVKFSILANRSKDSTHSQSISQEAFL